MTIKDYFKSRLRQLSITMSDEDLEVFFLSKEITGTNDLEKPGDLDILFTEIVLQLLVLPDVSEDDYSISFDRSAITKWYSFECARLGIDNLLNKGENEVKDMSFLA